MKKLRQILWLLPLVIIFFANIGWGQLLLNDNFSYTAGTLLTANGWTAHSGAGTNPITVTAPGLTYAGYIGSGIDNAATMVATGEDDNRSFTAQTSGSVYYSFMVNFTSATLAGDYFIHLQTGTTSFYGRLYVKRDASNNLAFAVNRGSVTTATTYTGFTYSLNTTYLVVIKYTYVAGTLNDVADLFINPVINGSEPSPTISSTDATSAEATTIDRIGLRQGGATSGSTQIVDGIRVGTSWNDVVPVLGGAVININPSTLPAFTTSIGVPSSSKTYTVSASDLTNDLVITAPANFEIRENGFGTFGSSLTYTPVSGTVTQKTIEVRVNSGIAGTYTGFITNVSSPATTQNVAVTGAVNTLYYNKSGLNLDDVLNWGTDPDGNGTQPANFTSANQTFIITNGTNPPMSATWAVSGGYSKVILGDGVNPIGLTVNSTYALTGTLDVTANATLTLQNSTLPTFGTLNASSTVSFEQAVPTVIPAATYGNLTAVGSIKTFAAGTTNILGNLIADAVTDFDGSASPFSTVYLAGNFTLINGTAFTPTALNRLTLNCNGTSVQTLTGNNSDFKLFRITLLNSAGVVLSNTGGTSNLVLGNASGGGYTLTTGDLTVNDNSISFYQYGKAVILGTGNLICSPNSNLALSGNGTSSIGTLKLKTGNETINNFTIDITGGGASKTITLGSNLTVNGILNMSTNTAGKISLGAFNLTLGSSASITGLSDSNYVVTGGTGELMRNISNNDTYVTFPVGPTITAYNPVNIKLDLASTPDVFGVKVSGTITNPPVTPAGTIQKEWSISEGTPGGSNATLQFHFGLADFGASFDSTLSNYDIGHYVSPTGYVVYGGNISPSVNGLFAITSTSVISSFSPFIVGNYGSVTGVTALSMGLTAMLSGNYNGTTMVPKSVAVELHNSTTPYALVESQTITLDANGLGNPVYTTASNGTPYYIVIKSDNGLETWSATPQTFTGSALSYDFTTDATQAFGSNMLLVGTKWCIISGDANQDGSIDAADRSLCWNERNLFGIYATDFNGDGSVDAADRSIAWNNRNLAVAKPALLAKPTRGVKQDNKGNKDSSKGTFDLKLDGKNAKKVTKTK